MGDRAEHAIYNKTNYPIFVANNGNWDIYRNRSGYCAAIPTDRGAAMGCIATHFGDAKYASMMLKMEIKIGDEAAL